MPTLYDASEVASRAPALARLIQSLNPIGLAEMDRVALMNRVDTKFVINRDTLLDVLGPIASDYRVLEVDGQRISPYATLYFDTPALDCYLEHHNRKLNRRKYRMRKYLASGVSFLEIKAKSNRGRTDKQRTSLEDIEETVSSESAEFIRSVTGDLPDLQPQLWTYFSRVTLVNKRHAERVTLDWGLDFRDRDSSKKMPDVVIAEIKQESDDRSTPVRQQLRELAIRPMRVSKYCLGSMLLRPALKRNRFKKKLLAIERIA